MCYSVYIVNNTEEEATAILEHIKTFIQWQMIQYHFSRRLDEQYVYKAKLGGVKLIKHFSLFSGIESFKKAMTNLDIDNELVGYSELDKYASVALSAVHGVSEELNYGDITKIDEAKVPDCDLITYGFPCQDISVAGLGKGIVEGETRSGLLHDALRIIKYKKPKYAIAENVKNLVGKRFKEDFERLLTELESYGYNNYWKVLNAKDYGIPQNRERVFVVSVRKDIDDGEFEFPKPFDNGLRLKDLLEDEVEDKYYINKPWHFSTVEDQKHDNNEIAQITGGNFKATRSITDVNKIMRCLDTMGGGQREPKVAVKENTKKGYDIAAVGDSINISFPNSKTRRGRVGKEVAQTLETQSTQATLQSDYKIRKLTPLECWRLMGFDDLDYWNARKTLENKFYNGKDRSNSQMYKMAGNSIVVDVLEGVLKNLIN